jgi:transketolase
MQVFAPCDAIEARKIVYAISKVHGPCYARFAREKTPVFTTEDTPLEIGKAQIFFEPSEASLRPSEASGGGGAKEGGLDVAIIACGPLVHNAILAAAHLERQGMKIRVINNPTIKPMDEDTITLAAKDAGAVVTVEEHQVAGGMGSEVAELLAREHPVPIEFIGVQNRFGESGSPPELLEHFGMGVTHIVAAARKVISRK